MHNTVTFRKGPAPAVLPRQRYMWVFFFFFAGLWVYFLHVTARNTGQTSAPWGPDSAGWPWGQGRLWRCVEGVLERTERRTEVTLAWTTDNSAANVPVTLKGEPIQEETLAPLVESNTTETSSSFSLIFFGHVLLTPSLPQPVKCLGWRMHGRTCKQAIFWSCNIYFRCYAFWWKSFHLPVWKIRQKGLRVSNFTLLWVVFKWHHGSEGVKQRYPNTQKVRKNTIY